jgi:hypothetical protein
MLCGPAAIILAVKSRRDEGVTPHSTWGLALGIITTILASFAVAWFALARGLEALD